MSWIKLQGTLVVGNRCVSMSELILSITKSGYNVSGLSSVARLCQRLDAASKLPVVCILQAKLIVYLRYIEWREKGWQSTVIAVLTYLKLPKARFGDRGRRSTPGYLKLFTSRGSPRLRFSFWYWILAKRANTHDAVSWANSKDS